MNIASEISKQITEKEIRTLIIRSFTHDYSDFASSVKTISYVETKKLFDTKFFVDAFANAIKSGVIDTYIKNTLLNVINKICADNRNNFTSANNIRNVIMSAFIQLTTKEYNESEFWDVMRKIVKPSTKAPISEDIDKIVAYINQSQQTDFKIGLQSHNVNNAFDCNRINTAMQTIFKELSNSNIIANSIRRLHSDDVKCYIENAWSNANGKTIQEKDEFEDDFDTSDNALEAQVERLRFDIRKGFAKSYIEVVGPKPTHPKRISYTNAIVSDNDVINVISTEMRKAMEDSFKSVSEDIIKEICNELSKHIEQIVNKYCSDIINCVNDNIKKLYVTNNVGWNKPMMSMLSDTLLDVVKSDIKRIAKSLTDLIIRTINTNNCREMVKNILSTFNCNHDIPNTIRFHIAKYIVNCNEYIGKIIDIEAQELKKMYNEAYKDTPYEQLCNLCTNGTLDCNDE